MFKKTYILTAVCFTAVCFFMAPVPVLASEYDFEVLEAAYNPSPPPVNAETEIKFKIKYTGNYDLTDRSLLEHNSYIFGDATVYNEDVPAVSFSNPIESGKTFYITYTVMFRETGRQGIRFTVNDRDDPLEASKSNNGFEDHVNVINPDDFSVASIEVYPANPVENSDVYVKVGIKNAGTRDLISDVGLSSYEYEFSGFELEREVKPYIAVTDKFEVNEIVYFQFYGQFQSAGRKQLEFTIDSQNNVEERNEVNNIFSQEVTIYDTAAADIKVKDISLDVEEDRLIKGRPVTITVEIENSGLTSLIEPIGFGANDINYKFDGVSNIVKTSNNPFPTFAEPLAKNDTYTYVYAGQLTGSGPVQWQYTLDQYDKLSETDEDNNVLSKALNIYATELAADSFDFEQVRHYFYSSASTTITWHTDLATDAYVEYRPERYSTYDMYHFIPPLDDWPASLDKMNHSVRIKNLKPDTVYKYRITGTKNSVEKQSAEYEFRTPASNVPSLLGSVRVSAKGPAQTVTAQWRTDIMSDSFFYYRLAGNENYQVAQDSNFTSEHSLNVDGLEYGDYEYYVKSVSKFGQAFQSQPGTFELNEDSQAEEPVEPPVIDEPDPRADDPGSDEEPQPKVDTDSGWTAGKESIQNQEMYNHLKGKIILQVEAAGEAYWVDPRAQKMYFLGRPADAFTIMREQGVGISNADLYKIPVGSLEEGADSDGDGLNDNLEDALGLDPAQADTDGDGYSDKQELDGGYSPWGPGQQNWDTNFSGIQSGKILLQVEKHGEAWYINPADNKRYFLGRPADAFAVMRGLGLGVSNDNFEALQ